jgi:hypothetical protein
MLFDRAIPGFLFSLRANGYSHATLDLYGYLLGMLAAFLNNPPIGKITHNDLVRYWLTFTLKRLTIYSAKAIMGLADLQVLRRYLAQTTEDIAQARSIGSPVDYHRPQY